MENASDSDKQAVVAKEFTKSSMAIIFFDNIYYSEEDKLLTDAEVDDNFSNVAFNFLVKAESPVYQYSPVKTFFSLIYRFAEYFPSESLTRDCADAIEESEIAVHNLAERENPTLITNCRLIYYVLMHVHPVIDKCSESITKELAEKETYVAMGNYDERIASVEHWLEQDHRVFTNLLETIVLARLDEVDYDGIGWYIGDSLGRLMLRPADHDQ